MSLTWHQRLALALACAAAVGVHAASHAQPTALRTDSRTDSRTADPAAAASATLSFTRALDAALSYDAQFMAAGYEREAVRAGVAVARASLLPTLNLSASSGRTTGTRELPNALGQRTTLDLDYRTPQTALQLRVPLFNYESLSRYRQAMAQSGAAEALLQLRRAELLERLGLAYLQGILAEETVALTLLQLEWLEAQRDRAAQRLQRGEGSRIELADAVAQLSVAQARLLDARDVASAERHNLARITGIDGALLPKVGSEIQPAALVPSELAQWHTIAANANPGIRTREQVVEAARLAVQRNLAGHLPRLDLVASHSRSSNDSTATTNQVSNLSSVSLQFNLPLFSGGGVEAGVRQAQLERLRVEAELTQERRNVEQEVQRQYLVASKGGERIAFFRQAVASSELMLEGLTRGVAAGLRTHADVMEAGAKLQLARRDLAQARVEYLLARLRLHSLSGLAVNEAALDLERQFGAH